MLKRFRIDYVKHGTVCDYRFSEIIEARSAKMALKKFLNHREYPKDKTRSQWMWYDRVVNGITYDINNPIEI